jgi:uncharacterized protein (TIGR02001 family)
MNRLLPAAAALGLLALPAGALAQDVSVYAGVALTTDYLSNGLTQTDGKAAVQPYVEVEVSGFYAGIWASNVRFPGEDDRIEVDLYAGFRNSVGAFSYDIGYARYFYDDSGNCCGEILLSLGLDTDVGMSFGTAFAYDPSDKILTSSISAAYGFNDAVSVSAEAGRVQNSHNFWNVGGSYAFNDMASFDLRVHDTNITKTRVVATLSFDFSIR